MGLPLMRQQVVLKRKEVTMPEMGDIRGAILDKINDLLRETTHRGDTRMILDLAEAHAWLGSAAQAHGARTEVKTG
jgi:hypothetical protein